MANIIQGSFRLNLFILKTFYMCPPKKQTLSHKLQSYVAYVLIVVIVPVISILHLLLAEDLDMDRVNYNSAFVAQATCSITKFLPFILDGQRLIYHAAKILKDNLQNVCDYADEPILEKHEGSMKNLTKQEIIIELVKKCISHHDEILKFVTEFEDCSSVVLFSQMAGTMFVICFSCLQLSKLNSVDSNFGQFAMILIVILAQIYFYCYYGATLSEQSESLIDAIYMGPWYTYDVRTQRTLLTIMERSKIPVTITAGKLVDLSLPTFTPILRRSYSLIAVMKNYQ
ncbi:hypothetical protein Zmor_026648 [Zophobas morio]|uniref:Uncharacterized protein n=1 Tax=Zophobas morio TaxID=2755281 RepID=A0AA38HUR3_9CUCU|nr:hypothetical protein Zmor_026648 [Zophobas morio]